MLIQQKKDKKKKIKNKRKEKSRPYATYTEMKNTNYFNTNCTITNPVTLTNIAQTENLANLANLASAKPFATLALPLHTNFKMNAFERACLKISVCIVDLIDSFSVLPRKGCCGGSHQNTPVGIF